MMKRIFRFCTFIPFIFWGALLLIYFVKSGRVFYTKDLLYVLGINLLAGLLMNLKPRFFKILGLLSGFGLGLFLALKTHSEWYIGQMDYLGASAQFVFYFLLTILSFVLREKKTKKEVNMDKDFPLEELNSLEGRKRIKTARSEDGKRINSTKRTNR